MNTTTATETLNAKQQAAMDIARARGSVVAGINGDGTKCVRVAASTIRALARRGLLTLATGPDGDTMGRPV